jgi:hypothetical protein
MVGDKGRLKLFKCRNDHECSEHGWYNFR